MRGRGWCGASFRSEGCWRRHSTAISLKDLVYTRDRGVSPLSTLKLRPRSSVPQRRYVYPIFLALNDSNSIICSRSLGHDVSTKGGIRQSMPSPLQHQNLMATNREDFPLPSPLSFPRNTFHRGQIVSWCSCVPCIEVAQ